MRADILRLPNLPIIHLLQNAKTEKRRSRGTRSEEPLVKQQEICAGHMQVGALQNLDLFETINFING